LPHGDRRASPVLLVLASVAAFSTFPVVTRFFTGARQVVTAAGLASQARWLALRRFLHDDEAFSGLPPTAVVVR